MPQGEEEGSVQEKGEADSKLHCLAAFMTSEALSTPKMALGNTLIKHVKLFLLAKSIRATEAQRLVNMREKSYSRPR